MGSAVQQINIPDQFVDFRPRRYAYVLLNSKRKPMEVRFDGTLITVPPVHEVGSRSDTDSRGTPIPGSRVIEDVYVPVPEISDEVLVFDARRAVVHILGLQIAAEGGGHVATSPHAHAGLSLLPRHPDPELWRGAAASGEHRAFLKQVEIAQQNVDAFETGNAKRKSMELSPTPPNRDYYAAVELLNQYAELVKADVAAVMAPHQEDALEAELELEAMVRAKAIELATKAAPDSADTQAALVKDLLTNPKVRQLVQKDFRIRRRGHMQPTPSELAQAAEEGTRIDSDEDGAGTGE